jgi:hypothetical protein
MGGPTIEEMPNPPDALTGAPDAQVVSLAVIDRSGVPIVTYGHFALDESLISGMVSVIDSLSEEMFGSRASKTHLAGADVVHFAYGAHTILLTTFDDEPSPVQLAQLREYIDEFEAVNVGRLAESPIDVDAVTAIEVPFRFRRYGEVETTEFRTDGNPTRPPVESYLP